MTIYKSTRVSPYVYMCVHKETSQFYIGYREVNKVPSDIDLPKYKSSSKDVKPNFQEYEWKIIAEFSTGNDAYDFEQQLIYENWDDPLLLNKNCQFKKGRWKNHRKGKRLSEEHRAKLSIAAKLRPPVSEETKAKHSNRIVTEETKKKMSEVKKGKIFTEEHKAKLSENAKKRPKGRIVTEETRQRLKLAITKSWVARRLK